MIGLGILAAQFVAAAVNEWKVACPVDLGTATLVDATIDTGAGGDIYLRMTFSAPVQARHLLDGAIQQVGPADVMVEVSPWPAASAAQYLGDQGFTFVHYIVDAGVALAGPPAVDGNVARGAAIAAATTTLHVAFLREQPNGTVTYVHPAVALRILGRFDQAMSELVVDLVKLKPAVNGLFFLDAFLPIVDDAVSHARPNALFLRTVLMREHADVRDAAVAAPAGGLGRYESRLTDLLARRIEITSAALQALLNDTVLFEAFIAGATDHAGLWHVTDKQLGLFVVSADNISIDPISLDSVHFTELWSDAGHRAELFTNRNFLAVFNGPFFGSPSLTNAGFPFPAEARIKFRDDPTVVDEVAKIRDQEKTQRYRLRRYHYLQRQVTSPATLIEFHVGPLPDSTVSSPFQTGADDLLPVIIGGVRMTAAAQHDVAWYEGVSPVEGMPMFGQAIKNGRRYLFWLGRMHRKSDSTWEANATIADMVTLLQTLGATDAVITDGADSIGLIVKGLGIVPGLEPELNYKNRAMPIALGFRKLP